MYDQMHWGSLLSWVECTVPGGDIHENTKTRKIWLNVKVWTKNGIR